MPRWVFLFLMSLEKKLYSSVYGNVASCFYITLFSEAEITSISSIHLYSAPNKESTFSEILISAVKSTFSHSNHRKSIKELFWRSFLKICFSPYITHREDIEVQKQFLGKLSNFQQNEQYLRICMELRFQIWSTHTLT